MKTKLSLILLLLLFNSCKRNYVETYIQVRLTYVENDEPVPNATLILKREKFERSDRKLSKSYHEDTFRTNANGEVDIYKELSDKKEYHYSLYVLQGDSNANSKTSQVIVPGYPNFYRVKVNKSFPVKVFIVHNSVSAAENRCNVYWWPSESPGSKFGYTSVNLEKSFDTVFTIQALNQHTMKFDIHSIVRNPDNTVLNFSRSVRVATDINSTTSITLLY